MFDENPDNHEYSHVLLNSDPADMVKRRFVLSQKPVLIACSAEDPEVIYDQCIREGFNEVYQILSVSVVRDYIIPYVESHREDRE